MAPSFQNLIEPYTVTIGSAGSFSGSVYLNGNGIIAIGVPGTFTTTPLTFQTTLGSVAPSDGGAWVNVYAGSVEYAVGTLYGTAVQFLPPADLPSVYWLRLRSGNAAGGTVQNAAREFVIFSRPI